jgi:hypothetical protein
MIVALVSSYREGPPLVSTIRSALAACDLTIAGTSTGWPSLLRSARPSTASLARTPTTGLTTPQERH